MRFYTNVQMVGDHFLVRGYEDGKHFMTREKFNPTLFVPANKKTKYQTLTGDYVEAVQPGCVRDCREFIKKYEGVENFKIYGNTGYIYQYISEMYPEEEIKFDTNKIKITTLDIEVASENGFPDVESAAEEVLLITIQDYATKQIRTWGKGSFSNKQDNVIYKGFRTEYELLDDFINWWMIEQNTPEVVTGWNSELYDIPYLVRRIDRILGEKLMKRLSPWGLVTERETFIAGRKHISYDVGGITQLDYLQLYKKFTYKAQESYRLDYIASVELGKKKLDHSEFDTFKDFYTHGWQKFVEYNIIDVELVDRMEDKMKLIELAVTMAYDAKANYADVFSQVRMWDTIIYNYLKQRNIVIPPKERSDKDSKYAGAYVKEPIPGKYDWVVSFDLNSLYPHLIMQYNISPETLLDERHPSATVDKILNQDLTFELYKDYAVCANGAMFRKDVRGFLPELMEKIYKDRTIFKKKMLAAKQEYEKKKTKDLEKEIARCNNIQMARKIQLNSAYGAIGNQYFRYYKLANAEAITLSGQVSIRWIENKVNTYLNKLLQTEEVDYVIASDTDSIYLNMGPLVTKFFGNKSDDKAAIVSILDKICHDKLEPFIESSYQELADYVSAYEQKMQMKRENIAERGIWTAKKRYIEYLWPDFVDNNDIEDAFCVDCGLTYDSTPVSTISGLDHLEGKIVSILADGAAHPNRTVESGSVTLQRTASVVHVGLPYVSLLQTMRPEAGAGDGTAQGKTKRINKMVIRFLATVGAKAGPDVDHLDEIQFRSGSALMDAPVPLFTGDKIMEWPGGYDFDGYMIVEQDQPLPMTVVALMPQLQTQDR